MSETEILWNSIGLLKKARRARECGMLPEPRQRLDDLIPRLETADAEHFRHISRYPIDPSEEDRLWRDVASLCAQISELIADYGSYA